VPLSKEGGKLKVAVPNNHHLMNHGHLIQQQLKRFSHMEDTVLKKFTLTLGFVMTVIVLMGGSCGTPPKAQLSNPVPSALTFSLQQGKSGSKTVALENTGDDALTYELSSSSTQLLFSSKNGSIAPGKSATIAVIGTCTNSDNSSETITVKSNGGNATIPITSTCPRAANSAYNIDIRFIGNSTTDEQKAAFTQSELRWEGVITEDFQDVTLPAPGDITPPAGSPRLTEFCDAEEPDLEGEIVDDLIILAKVGPIDGDGDANGNILAQAGPVLIHDDADQLTLLGCMIFDENDIDLLVQGGSFANVVQHEMGHVLGIGTYWNTLFDATCPNTGTVGFTGSNSIVEFGVLAGLGDGSTPPVETQGGAGTACGHWDEGFFDNELMTGLAEKPGIAMPLSKLTIASLEDVGYDVDYTQATAPDYKLPACKPNCTLLEPQTQTQVWERLLKPLAAVNSKGDVVSLEQAR
jgi:hypothetical protein